MKMKRDEGKKQAQTLLAQSNTVRSALDAIRRRHGVAIRRSLDLCREADRAAGKHHRHPTSRTRAALDAANRANLEYQCRITRRDCQDFRARTGLTHLWDATIKMQILFGGDNPFLTPHQPIDVQVLHPRPKPEDMVGPPPKKRTRLLVIMHKTTGKRELKEERWLIGSLRRRHGEAMYDGRAPRIFRKGSKIVVEFLRHTRFDDVLATANWKRVMTIQDQLPGPKPFRFKPKFHSVSMANSMRRKNLTPLAIWQKMPNCFDTPDAIRVALHRRRKTLS